MASLPTPNMGLILWPAGTDHYDHNDLTHNWSQLEEHRHVPSEDGGLQIPEEGLESGAASTRVIENLAVTEGKIGPRSVTSGKIALSGVITENIADGDVSRPKIANDAVNFDKLDPNVRPIGEVIMWWRKNNAEAIPEGWVVADGRTLTSSQHDFIGGGNVVIPDLRNRFVLGAVESPLDASPTNAPGIGTTGGSNIADLTHTHTIPGHTHTINAHTHTIPGHTHVVENHRHQVNSHTHAQTTHRHTVDNHVHAVPAHNHFFDHYHKVEPHDHGIAFDGWHDHGYGPDNHSLWSRRLNVNENPGDAGRQALFVQGFNDGGTSVQLDTRTEGLHDHGGFTGGASPDSGGNELGTYGPIRPGVTEGHADSFRTADWGGNTEGYPFGTTVHTGMSEAVNTGASSPYTSYENPPTTSVALTTNSTGGTTASSGTLTTGAGDLDNQTDVRPRYVGLLFLIRVRR